ncbi:MAG: hypothetical protein KGL12_06355 [Rhodospirillales bacterium]|nr:hypothetical protein [Rhodospirillales bacterium]
MFKPLRNDIVVRFDATKSFFSATRHLDGDNGATARGLVFIQIYAAYEYVVNSVVRIGIDCINAHEHKMKDLSKTLLALYLDSEFDSVRNSGQKNVWRARLNIFESAFSDKVIALPNNVRPPTDGNHYRRSHLDMILEVFGAGPLPISHQHLFKIDEIVNHRNQIAHGGETASEVGRRYTIGEVSDIIDQIHRICVSLVDVFEVFCANGSRHKRQQC